MNAKQHTRKMLLWLRAVGIERLDLALRQSDATMIWHRSKNFGQLPLSWARALNVRQAEVYVRPARGESWPVVFLDDVEPSLAVGITRKCRPGGGHLTSRWLPRVARLPPESLRVAKGPGPALARSESRSGSSLDFGRAPRPARGLQELETLRGLGEHDRILDGPAVGSDACTPRDTCRNGSASIHQRFAAQHRHEPLRSGLGLDMRPS